MKRLLIFLFLSVSRILSFAQSNDYYETSVTFPASYQVGDYIEFVKVSPAEVGAAGYYEVSLSYTRTNIAAAATHIVSVSHANPVLWREAARVNANNYIYQNVYSFTVDCNTQPGNSRFRIRAVATHGIAGPVPVFIKVRSIGRNLGWQSISQSGNDQSIIPLLPMTADWTLTTGKLTNTTSANIAIHADVNGNVGIGTKTPTEKLSVNGRIRAKEIKVESSPWPDYVFKKDYKLPSLIDVERFILEKGHLPEVPSAKEVEQHGIALGANQALLLKKIEELTLYLIELKHDVNKQKMINDEQGKIIVTQAGEIEKLKLRTYTK